MTEGLVQIGRGPRPGGAGGRGGDRVGPAGPPFLPMTRADLDARGWDAVDIVIVTGDAYVDHPAFGPVLIARFLEKRGFRVGIVAQPDWRSAEPFRALGRPRLFFGVAAGNLDSMLNRLTAQKKNRGEDQYSPGGRTGCRPDRATVVCAQRCREAFPGVPVILGGIEASLRRIAHYDYWSDTVRRSILFDAKADLLVYVMGERPIWEIARRLAAGETVKQLRDVRGTGYIASREETALAEAAESEHVRDGRGLEAGVELLRHRRAAQHVAPLQHQRLEAGLREQGRGDEAVVAAADDDDVRLQRMRPFFQSFRTSRAAMRPGAAMIPPPGCVAEPHM